MRRAAFIALACAQAASGQCHDWMQFDEGFTAPVNSIVVGALAHYQGDLYAGGGFTHSGSQPLSRIAQWRHGAWLPVGGGLTSTVAGNHAIRTMIVHDGELYVGGQWFTHAGGVASNSIARWDGATWRSVAGGVGPQFSTVLALEVYQDDLYVGGQFANAGGVLANNIARWDGREFHPVGSGLTGGFPTVRAMRVYSGQLYVAGSFTLAGGMPVNHIARWNGNSWAAVGTIAPQSLDLHALEVFDDGAGEQLYLAGRQVMGSINSLADIARWNETTWTPATIQFGQPINADNLIFDLQAIDGLLYASGLFTSINGIPVNRVFAFNAGLLAAFGGAEVGANAAIYAVAPTLSGPVNSFIAGGAFTFAGGEPANAIARWSCADNCAADLTGDSSVDARDLALLLGSWGACDCPADLNRSGAVNASDLALLLGNWTECMDGA